MKHSKLPLLVALVAGLAACNSGGGNTNSNSNQIQSTTNTNTLSSKSAFSSGSNNILLPYVQLNVDEQDRFYWYKGASSPDTNNAVATFGSYFPESSDATPASSFTVSGDNNLQAFFGTAESMSIYQTKPLMKADFTNFAKDSNCQILDNDPNKLACNLTINASAGLFGTVGNLPVILYAGLRAYNVEEMIRDFSGSADANGKFDGNPIRQGRWDKDNNADNANEPYYMEISATPADFSTKTTVVDLHKYFYSPDNQETFSFDASKLNTGVATSCNIVKITGVDSQAKSNPVQCSDSLFSIDGSGNLQASNLTAGVYQINVKASEKNEQDWQTFYLNVATTNPSLSAWRNGAVATSNLVGDFPSIYVYSSQDPDKKGANAATTWPTDYQTYGSDLQKINTTAMTIHPIKTALAEIISMTYTFTPAESSEYKISFWKLSPNSNPESQITAAGVGTNRSDSDFARWIGDLIDPTKGAFASKGVGLTLNYDFDNQVKADLVGFNPEQQDIVADTIVHPIVYASQVNPNYKIDGLAMDLEAGFNQINAAITFKKVADRLAYHGKWFNYFYFSDVFNPLLVSSFGPLGVANFSTYDVGQYRAPQSTGDQTGMVPYTVDTYQGAFNTAEAASIYNAFSTDANGGLCDQLKSGDMLPVGYCSLSLNDSISENNRRFNGNYHTVSTEQAMTDFDGKYSPILPLAASATEWNNVEMWNPDFTIPAGSQHVSGVLINNSACAGINNQFLQAHESDLNNQSSPAYGQLAKCLMADTMVGSVPVQTFSHCGNQMGNSESIPYAQCILVSNIPGKGIGDQDVKHPISIDFAKNNLQVYASTIQHQTGYSVFALETPAAATSGAFGSATIPNKNVQEPWYIGYNYTPSTNPKDGEPYDPEYSPQASDQEWQAFATVINNYYCNK